MIIYMMYIYNNTVYIYICICKKNAIYGSRLLMKKNAKGKHGT